MTPAFRFWRATRRFCWLILLVCVTACGGGTTTGANTLARGVPQDDAMVENDGMNNGDGAGDAGQEVPENGDAAPANGEDDEKSLTVGGRL